MVRQSLATLAIAACTGLLARGVVSCRTPTEITVVVTTDFDCTDLKDVTVTVGTLGDALETDPPTSTSTFCADGSAGSMVVIPHSSDSAEVAIKVVGGFGTKQAEDCVPATGSSPPDYGAGCIVARRALDFTPHTPLTVPVVLRASCNGVACDETQTCVEGTCVTASAPKGACTGALGCGECDLVDGGCAAPDGGIPTAFTGCGDMSGLQAGAVWPMGNGCPTNVSRSPYVAQSNPAPKWSFSTRGNKPINAAPVIDLDGTIYFGSQDGYAYALEPDTGAKTWEWAEPSGAEVTGGFAIGADGRVAGTSLNNAFALDSVTGAQAWLVAAASGTDVTITTGELAIFGEQTQVVALEVADSGGQAWASAVQGAIGIVAVAVGPDGTVYGSSGDHSLYALDATTHAVTWQYTMGDTPSAPTYAGGAVYGETSDTGLVALDPHTGSVLWIEGSATGNCNVPVATDGTIYAPAGNSLEAVDPSGHVVWSVDTGAALSPCMVIDGAGTVLVMTGDELAAYEPVQGGQLWSVAAASDGLLAIGADGKVFEATSDGRLLAFGN